MLRRHLPLIDKSRADMLAAMAQRAGCKTVVRAHQVDLYGRHWVGFSLECSNNENAVNLLNVMAAELDGVDPQVIAIASSIRQDAPSMPEFAQAVQQYIKDHVQFRTEPLEIFQGALVTLARGAGDCDDHARTVAGILIAGGERARIMGVRNSQGQIAHVCAQVLDRGVWTWCETTVDARYGEPPRDAAVRLGLAKPDRPDLLGKVPA